MKIRELRDLLLTVLLFPYVVAILIITVLVFGRPTPDEEESYYDG